MSDTRRRAVAVALVLAVGLVAAGTVAAVTVGEEDVSERERVGETVTATVTLEELYQNPNYEEWSVAGETELENVTWTVEFVGQTGEEIRQVEVDGQGLNRSALEAAGENPAQLAVDADADTAPATVRVQVTGDVPGVESYTYPALGEDGSAESFLTMQLTQDRGAGGTANTIDEWETVHFTQESQQARSALDGARATIEEARAEGLDVADAEESYSRARTAYQEENFDLATDLAADAESSAQDALDSQGGGLPVVLIGAAVVVVLVAAAVGVYLYRQRQEPDTKLR